MNELIPTTQDSSVVALSGRRLTAAEFQGQGLQDGLQEVDGCLAGDLRVQSGMDELGGAVDRYEEIGLAFGSSGLSDIDV